MISHKHKCIFVHIPKTAGQSITKMFGKHGKIVCHHHPTPLQCTEYKKHWNEYYTFTCVRNPFDRLVSWYAFMKKRASQGNKAPSTQICENHSFKDFVLSYLGNENYLKSQLTIMPLVNWLPKEYPYDQILRFENISEDVKILEERLSIKGLPKINCTKRGSYQEFYDSQTIKRVKQYYKDDLDKFGYTYDE